MKRPMTLMAGILGVVACSGLILTIITSITGFFELMSSIDVVTIQTNFGPIEIGIGGIRALIIYSFIVLALCISSLILNAVTISAWKKPHEEYKKQKANIITAIVFNFLVAFLGFIYSFVLGDFFFMIAAAVLLIVDLSIENKRHVKFQEKQDGLKENTPINSLEEKLEKLNKMREEGIITEEEYQELKNSYIQQEINK